MTTSNVAALSPESVAPRPPCQPILWRVLVRPLPPRHASKGGIVLPEETRAAEQINTCVGRVEAMGTLAFQAQTKAGLDLSREANRPRVGTWVLFHQYAGHKTWVGDTEYVLLADTDIMAVTDEPEQFRNYI